MLWMGIWVCTYTLTPVQVGAKFWKLGVVGVGVYIVMVGIDAIEIASDAILIASQRSTDHILA